MQNQSTYFYLNFFNYPCPIYAPIYPQAPQHFDFYAQIASPEQLPLFPCEPQPLEIKDDEKKHQTPKLQQKKQKKPQKQSIYYQSDESSYEMQKAKKKRSKAKVRNSLYYFQDLYKKNATSNILRNFFRNIIELKIYGSFISRIFVKLGIQSQIQEFYAWINSYNINSKKFINRAMIFKILTSNQHVKFRKVLGIVLYRFLNDESVCCILTSKRYLFKKNQLFGLRVLMKKIAALQENSGGRLSD